MKKLICLALSLTMALTLLSACGGKDTGGAAPSSTALSGVVNTDGSTSMADVMAVLQETFQEKYSGVTVNYSGTGSGAGVEAVLSGTADLGLASRSLKDEEKAKGAVEHIVALDGVAVVVNPGNGVEALSMDEVAAVFTGEIANWSELGGENLAIAVLGREDGSGTRGAFEEIVGVEGECAYKNEYGSTGDVIGSVASNPGAIGYASLSAVDESVKALKIDGAAPSEESVKDGSYPIQRPFVMVTKDGTALSEAAQAFLDYAVSPDAAEYIALAGAVAP